MPRMWVDDMESLFLDAVIRLCHGYGYAGYGYVMVMLMKNVRFYEIVSLFQTHHLVAIITFLDCYEG